MNKTFVKNRGTTTFITSIPGENFRNSDNYNKIDWDIDYDGKIANIEMDVNSNGESNHYNYELSNNDLEDILKIPSLKMPLEERLITDFPMNKCKLKHREPQINEQQPLFSKQIKYKPKSNHLSSLRRKLITSHPKTLRIILHPKSRSKRTLSLRPRTSSRRIYSSRPRTSSKRIASSRPRTSSRRISSSRPISFLRM